jgi:GAF domain-containing protein
VEASEVTSSEVTSTVSPSAVGSQSSIAAGVSELHDVLLSTQSIEDFVQELAEQAAQLIADSLSCGITLRRDGAVGTVACSDELAGEVNALQYRLGEGPGLTALAQGAAVQCGDLSADPRWPVFAPQAAARGVQSALSLPLIAQEQVIGALNLYGRERAAFGPGQAGLAATFAENAAGALALGLRLVSYAALNDQLRASLASRAVIDQAVGIIMGRERCTQDRAFEVLRTASQHRNVKLRALAQEMVAGVSGQAAQPPPFEG